MHTYLFICTNNMDFFFCAHKRNTANSPLTITDCGKRKRLGWGLGGNGGGWLGFGGDGANWGGGGAVKIIGFY